MGIRRWLNRSATVAPAGSSVPAALQETAGEPVKLSGTTTAGADAAQSLFAAHRRSDGGLLELPGQLVAEPENRSDPNAVAVRVEGARVGYLPGFIAAQAQLAAGHVLPCQVQLWGAVDRDRLRVIGWVAYGTGPVRWRHTPANPPPVTIAEQRVEAAAATTRMVDDALGGADPARAAEFRRGMVGRYHYLETVEPIKQLKRDGRLEEALELGPR